MSTTVLQATSLRPRCTGKQLLWPQLSRAPGQHCSLTTPPGGAPTQLQNTAQHWLVLGCSAHCDAVKGTTGHHGCRL